MSVFVYYDTVGKIHSFVTVNAPQGGGMLLTPKPGLLVAEVEGLEYQPGEAGHEALREIAKTHVVGVQQQRVTLVKKR